MKYLNLSILAILLSSCSSMKKSIGLGAAIGSTTGALIGNASGQGNLRDKSTLQGAAIGAGIGALIGYAGYVGKKDKQDSKLEDPHFDKNTPSLTAPKVRRVWVPARIEGEKYIDGHYMYVIEKTSSWSE